jgi:hypothetical protein
MGTCGTWKAQVVISPASARPCGPQHTRADAAASIKKTHKHVAISPPSGPQQTRTDAGAESNRLSQAVAPKKPITKTQP